MPPQRYSTAAITLHWLLAAALAFQISLGWTLEGPNTPELFTRYQLHKSVGITILVLTLVRLGIRLVTPRPAPSDGPVWTRTLATIVHWAFYAVMLLGPITGWLLVSTAKIQVPTLIFGSIPWPHLPVDRGWHEPAEALHSALAWVAIGLFALHIAGALRHQWLLGKPELQRMIPFARDKAVPVVIGALALIGISFAVAKAVAPNRATAPAPTEAAIAAAPEEAPQTEPAPTPEPAVPANTTEAAEEKPAPMPVSDWSVMPGGRLGFTARWNGEAINGRFARWQAAIRFSPDALDTSTIRVTINLGSADTADSQRDSSLQGSDFFDVASHPSAVFTSSDIRHRDGDRYEARGTLDLRGVKKPVTLRFTLKIDGDRARATGNARIDRTDFGVGQGQWAATDAIAGAVDITFGFSATRKE